MRIEGLILAAGLSSRAPNFKMTLPFGEITVLESAIKSMLPHCERIVVVGGHQQERLVAICQNYDAVELVVNEAYQEGMFSSIKCGLAHLKCDRFFMMPGDYPMIGSAVYERLLSQGGAVVIPSYNKRAGHPILIEGTYIESCLQEDAFRTMRDFIKTLEVHYVTVLDEGILMDLDTGEDYEKMKRRYKGANK